MIQLLIVRSTEQLDKQLMLKGVATLVIAVWHPVKLAGDLEHILLNITNMIYGRHGPFSSYLSKFSLKEPQNSYSNFSYKPDVCVNKRQKIVTVYRLAKFQHSYLNSGVPFHSNRSFAAQAQQTFGNIIK